MPDTYNSFQELQANEPDDAYRIEFQQRDVPILLLAPHGGMIEPGTSEICRAIAGERGSYYLFEGLKPENNWALHITSTSFDEPQALQMVSQAEVVVTIHGQAGAEHFVNVGGRQQELGEQIISSLGQAGFFASRHQNWQYAGMHPRNICNRGRSKQGVQLEISDALRTLLLQSPERFQPFVQAVTQALPA